MQLTKNTVYDDDVDELSGFLLRLVTLHAALGGSWVLNFRR